MAIIAITPGLFYLELINYLVAVLLVVLLDFFPPLCEDLCEVFSVFVVFCVPFLTTGLAKDIPANRTIAARTKLIFFMTSNYLLLFDDTKVLPQNEGIMKNVYIK
jgi:hypothetical protein